MRKVSKLVPNALVRFLTDEFRFLGSVCKEIKSEKMCLSDAVHLHVSLCVLEMRENVSSLFCLETSQFTLLDNNLALFYLGQQFTGRYCLKND